MFAFRLIPILSLRLSRLRELNTKLNFPPLHNSNWPTTSTASDGTTTTHTHQAIVLGLGSMFNHSSTRQNVGWRRDLARQVVVYIALRDVKRGEELLISYGGRLTFVDVEAEEEEKRRRRTSREDAETLLEALDVEGLMG